jgi:hypothetical protein
LNFAQLDLTRLIWSMESNWAAAEAACPTLSPFGTIRNDPSVTLLAGVCAGVTGAEPSRAGLRSPLLLPTLAGVGTFGGELSSYKSSSPAAGGRVHGKSSFCMVCDFSHTKKNLIENLATPNLKAQMIPAFFIQGSQISRKIVRMKRFQRESRSQQLSFLLSGT